MKKAEWVEKIRKCCDDAGTYRIFFDPVIDTLAGILEARDRAQEQFDQSKGNPVISYTNKGGATNLVKNPALVALMDLNAQALAYWRDLGLTPAGYKKLNADVVEKNTGGGLEKLLGKILEE